MGYAPPGGSVEIEGRPGEWQIFAATLPNTAKWVSPSPKYVGAGTDDRVIWGRRTGNRLLGEAMKEQSPSL